MHTILRKLGFSFDANNLDCTMGDCFFIIADEIAKLEKDELKRARKR